MAAIDGRGISVAYDARLARHLEAIEAKGRAQIAAARNLPEPSQARLDAPRLYERGTAQRHAELLKLYREVEAKLAGPQPSISVLDRILRREPPRAAGLAVLEREHAALRSELALAARQATSATAAVARATRELSAAGAARQAEADKMIRAGQLTLAEVASTRSMAAAYPTIVWGGPGFVSWAGQKIERRRRRGTLRNPWATNMWGLPIDPGY